MKWMPTTILITTLAALGPAHAQANLGAQTQALLVIERAAHSICYNVSQGGTKTATILHGAIQEVVGLNVTGTGQLRTEQYRGVIQSELSSTLKFTQDCKKSVFDTLIVRMVPIITANTGLPVSRSVHLIPRSGQQPSIDCAHTNEPIEDLLCADADLASWDGLMGQIYRQKLQEFYGSNQQAILRQSQRDWIKVRYANCNVPKAGSWAPMELAPAKPCILQMTKTRVTFLRNY